MQNGNSSSDEDSTSSRSDSGDSIENQLVARKQFQQMVAEASDRSNRRDSQIKLWQRAAAYAEEWCLHREAETATAELARAYINRRRYTVALATLSKLLETQEKQLGRRHANLANTRMLRGMCYLRMHEMDFAVKDLRDAVLHCQTATDVEPATLVESLCLLAAAYRQSGKFEKARTSILQAYAVLDDGAGEPDMLHVRVLEELAFITMALRKFQSATTAFERVIKLKEQLYGEGHEENIDSWIALGMCFYEMKRPVQAEEAFVRAIDLERMNSLDHKRLSMTMEKLAGLYRVAGRFREATMVEQGAGEVLGRAIDMRVGYLKAFDAGVMAHRKNKLDKAADCYKQALSHLEFVSDKHGADRIPVLARLLQISRRKNQNLQARTLEVDIEQAVAEAFPDETMMQGLLRLSRLFRVLGLAGAADACYCHMEYCLRKSQTKGNLLEVYEEHLNQLKCAEWTAEHASLTKKLRRLKRLRDGQMLTLEPVAPTMHVSVDQANFM